MPKYKTCYFPVPPVTEYYWEPKCKLNGAERVDKGCKADGRMLFQIPGFVFVVFVVFVVVSVVSLFSCSFYFRLDLCSDSQEAATRSQPPRYTKM
jgi:hypothetical protein